MKFETMKKLVASEAQDDFNRLVDAKLEALYMELDVLRNLYEISVEHSERLLLSRFFAFVAEIAVEAGEERDEFTDSMGAAFDFATAAAEDEEDEGDDGEEEEESVGDDIGGTT